MSESLEEVLAVGREQLESSRRRKAEAEEKRWREEDLPALIVLGIPECLWRHARVRWKDHGRGEVAITAPGCVQIRRFFVIVPTGFSWCVGCRWMTWPIGVPATEDEYESLPAALARAAEIREDARREGSC